MIRKPKRVSGRRRMTIDHPVQIVRQPDEAQPADDHPKTATRTARSLMSR